MKTITNRIIATLLMVCIFSNMSQANTVVDDRTTQKSAEIQSENGTNYAEKVVGIIAIGAAAGIWLLLLVPGHYMGNHNLSPNPYLRLGQSLAANSPIRNLMHR